MIPALIIGFAVGALTDNVAWGWLAFGCVWLWLKLVRGD